jgi:hypothetical protein
MAREIPGFQKELARPHERMKKTSCDVAQYLTLKFTMLTSRVSRYSMRCIGKDRRLVQGTVSRGRFALYVLFRSRMRGQYICTLSGFCALARANGTRTEIRRTR